MDGRKRPVSRRKQEQGISLSRNGESPSSQSAEQDARESDPLPRLSYISHVREGLWNWLYSDGDFLFDEELH